MSEEKNAPPASHLHTTRWLVGLGSAGLLCAMLTDSLAVAGRHTGLPLLGSIELVQACIVIMAVTAMTLTTIKQRHASIHILIDRVSDKTQRALHQLSATISATFFVALSTGAIWVLTDTWSGHERSELLHIPYAWLRVAAIIGGVSMTLFTLHSAITGYRRHDA